MEKAFDREKTGAADFLKNRFYDKYVIKEKDIPDSYYESLKRIDLELGKGYTEFTDFEKHEKAMNIIDSQKNRLDKWLNYLLKENTSYPMWARYWAFQGMVKLGQFNKDTGSFTRRSKGTVAPFPDLNAEALAKTIATVVDYQNGEDVDDEKLKELIKSGNFGKIYGYNIWKLLEDEKKYLETKVDTTDGIWKESENGSHQQVVKDLEGKVTGWCIQEESVALGYLENGKLHVYYTKDKNGDYSLFQPLSQGSPGQFALELGSKS